MVTGTHSYREDERNASIQVHVNGELVPKGTLDTRWRDSERRRGGFAWAAGLRWRGQRHPEEEPGGGTDCTEEGRGWLGRARPRGGGASGGAGWRGRTEVGTVARGEHVCEMTARRATDAMRLEAMARRAKATCAERKALQDDVDNGDDAGADSGDGGQGEHGNIRGSWG